MSELITTQALLPASWLEGHIILLPKPGSPADPSNYCPISLLQVVYKIYTKIIADCLSLVVGKHILLHHQMGFRPGMSAQSALQAVTNVLKDSKVQSTELHLAYIDCKKAFDSITHDTIFQALEYYGVGPLFIQLIHRLYEGSHSDVFINGEAGQPFPISRGVRQGDTLSPLLFIITINPVIVWIAARSGGYCFTNNLYISIVAYCDNLVLLANSASNMAKAFS
jgi:hypothetical protein